MDRAGTVCAGRPVCHDRNALALGTVLVLQGIPLALFMLVGGVVTDRISARSLMQAADLLRMVLFGILIILAGLWAASREELLVKRLASADINLGNA